MALRALGEGTIFAQVVGDQPKILALHGWGRRGSDFASALEGLSYLAPDLPGFGASPPPETARGAKGYVNLLAPLLVELSQPFLVVGHSFGGRVAVCLAANRPELVSGLVLSGAPLIRPVAGVRPKWRYRAGRWAHQRGLIGESPMEALRQRYGSADYRSAQGVMREVLVRTLAEDYREELARVECPSHLIWGALDHEVPVTVAEAAASLLKDSVLEIVPEVGHGLPIASPARLRSAVERMVGAS